MLSLEALRAANIARNIEWVGPLSERPYLSFRGCELGGEVGEALNIVKKIERERLGMIGSRATIEELGEELADVIISVDLMAMDLNIDLSTIVKNKFNKTSEKYGLSVKLD